MSDLPEHMRFFLAEEFTHLALSCAVEPLRLANLLSGRELYRCSLASRDGHGATSSSGAAMHFSRAYRAHYGHAPTAARGLPPPPGVAVRPPAARRAAGRRRSRGGGGGLTGA